MNRKEYLHSEIDRLNREIENDKSKINILSNKRAEQFGILKTHGALDEYSAIQQRKTTIEQQLESTKKRIEDLHRIEEFKSEINIQKEELLKRTRRDFMERSKVIESAMSQFNKNSETLYSEPGTLAVDITETGYKFNVDIKRAKSQGINYMKISCYDLTLVQLHPDIPGLLIHDSTIFDGVDERQIAKALELAATDSENKGFQYICTLNSDIVPYKEFSETFKKKFEESITIILTDGKEDSGLLGIRY